MLSLWIIILEFQLALRAMRIFTSCSMEHGSWKPVMLKINRNNDQIQHTKFTIQDPKTTVNKSTSVVVKTTLMFCCQVLVTTKGDRAQLENQLSIVLQDVMDFHLKRHQVNPQMISISTITMNCSRILFNKHKKSKTFHFNKLRKQYKTLKNNYF